MAPKRSQPTAKETLVGCAILLVLAGVAAGVYLKQFHYDASIYAVSVEAQPGAGRSRSSAVAAAAGVFAAASDLPALEPYTPAERFDAESLSEKINGKAPLYLDAGFSSLTCQRFRRAASEAWFEVYLYEMDDDRAAFSAYSTQRRRGAERLELADFASRSGGSLFFVRGRHYVEIIPSSNEDPQLREAVGRFAAALAGSLEGGGEIVELARLPREGLVAGSEALLSKNVFGIEGFEQVLSAEYRIGERTVTAFVARRADADAARRQAGRFAAFFQDNGGEAVEVDSAVPALRAVRIFDVYELIFPAGRYVAGVHECADVQAAVELAERLHAGLTGESE